MTTTAASLILNATAAVPAVASCIVCRSIPSALAFAIIFGSIVLLGVCGNAFVVCVIVTDRKLLHSSVNQFLLNLAVADIGHLLFTAPDMAMAILDHGWLFPLVSCRIIRFLQEYFLYSSVLLQMSIGIERFMAICSPLRMQRFSHRTTVLRFLFYNFQTQIIILVLVWAVALAFATPYFLSQGTLIGRNDIVYCGWLGISKEIKTIFKWAEFSILYAFPLVLLTVLYSIMGRVLWGTTVDGAIADETQQAAVLKLRRAVVRMLIISMCLYGLCYTPIQGIFLWESVYKRPVKMESWLRLALNAFSVSSSSANPVIYIMCCRHFHTRFVSLLRFCCSFCCPRAQQQKYACVEKDISCTTGAGESRISRSPYVSFRKTNNKTVSMQQQISLL